MNLSRLLNRFIPCAVLTTALTPWFLNTVTMGAEPTTLVATVLQDEPRKLPKDITATLTRADRSVRFELVKLSGESNQSLAGTTITVIDPNGESKRIKADEFGVATLEDATPGLNAIVIGGKQGHGAIPMAVREASTDAPETGGPATLRLPLVDVKPKEVIKLARSARNNQPEVDYSDIDTNFVSTAGTSDSFGYRVKLGSQNELNGQVMSLIRNGMSSADVAGTNVMLYSRNRLVGQAVADQRGYFQIPNLAPVAYDLIAVGPGGYAAFAFEAYSAAEMSQTTSTANVTLVSTSTAQPVSGDLLPVVLIPPPMVKQVVASLERSYGSLINGGGNDASDGNAGLAGSGAAAFSSLGAAGANAGTGPGGSSGGSAGGASAGAGAGGLGGLGGLGALGAAAAATAANSNGSSNSPGTNASESSMSPGL